MSQIVIPEMPVAWSQFNQRIWYSQ